MVEELGFSVGPGTTTFAAIRKEKVINLKAPYETDCSASVISNIPGYSKYTTSSCMLTCQTKHIEKECGCRDIKLPVLTDNPEIDVCGLNETATCVFREMGRNFYKVGGDNCSCQVPCETISYKPSLSYGGFPSKSVALDEGKRVWTPNTTTYKSAAEFADALHENMSENLLELNVYFQELGYQLIEQKPDYDKESLMGRYTLTCSKRRGAGRIVH
ncbi:Acid-sensing (proton-gated) ion channel member [Desmophyllum pertusum]|uniref:Acid-sensing (Proton-gated) ion channel member n=1 Tax=Desmophyllum pertusum TaxID=174260 RepID=A0A9X0CVN6_9CNID|nr:Acid-sensing (proton-gated) ion channel member [Desmophyllum pertusum]